MKIKCDWCGSWINDFDQVCPNCGGVNNNYNRHANGVPQTIEELKAWAKEIKRTVPGQYATREPMKPMRSTNFTRR